MKINSRVITLLIVGLAGLGLLFGGALALSARAQGALPPERDEIQAPDSPSSYIPFQGRLTDSAGNPLNGTYNITFRIYDVSTGGTALCSDTNVVSVTDGLFSTYVYAVNCAEEIDGRQLYMGIEVGTDGEMTPRAYIDNVPYAWSLRPGATIKSGSDGPLLYVYNTTNGEALWGASVYGEGVHGASVGGAGVGAYSMVGPALYAETPGGAAIAAGGTGVITSTAPTYLWISGSDVQRYSTNDSTVITMDTIGGAFVRRGATVGVKYVMLPVTIPGVLYGQNVTISAIDIYFVTETEFDVITDIRVRLQNGGVCPSCYLNLLYDDADHGCAISVAPTGCVLHYDLTANNTLGPNAGVIHIGLGLNFAGDSSYVDIGGVRLTLEHDH